MKKLIALALVIASASPAFAAGKVPGFGESFKDAMAKAKKENKLVYLHFTTDWCGWCRRIENDIYKKEAGQEALKNFVCASINCTRNYKDARFNQQLAQKYGVKGYPALVILAPDGTLIHQFSGYRKMDAFKAELKKAEKAFAAYKEILKGLKEGKDSVEFLNKAFDFYYGVKNWEKAAEVGGKLAEKDAKFEKCDEGKIRFAELMKVVVTGKGDFDAAMKKALETDKDGKNEVAIRSVAFDYYMKKAFMAGKKGDGDAKLSNAKTAIENMEKLLEKKNLPNKMGIHFTVARAYAFIKDFDKAIENIDAAIKLAGGNKRAVQYFQRFKAQLEKMQNKQEGN